MKSSESVSIMKNITFDGTENSGLKDTQKLKDKSNKDGNRTFLSASRNTKSQHKLHKFNKTDSRNQKDLINILKKEEYPTFKDRLRQFQSLQ